MGPGSRQSLRKHLRPLSECRLLARQPLLGRLETCTPRGGLTAASVSDRTRRLPPRVLRDTSTSNHVFAPRRRPRKLHSLDSGLQTGLVDSHATRIVALGGVFLSEVAQTRTGVSASLLRAFGTARTGRQQGDSNEHMAGAIRRAAAYGETPRRLSSPASRDESLVLRSDGLASSGCCRCTQPAPRAGHNDWPKR